MDEQIELWHERLGHMNFRDLRTLGKFNCVRGLPKLGKKANSICGPCQQGKQTKSMHKKGKYLTTKEPLELSTWTSWVPCKPKVWVERDTFLFVLMISLGSHGHIS
ncbi:hypothetical protein LWI29_037881 [Acer saccharum]|uniref:GAG-pre-integrase domain-containing protein n=1 Tax=Acer saccharum TaxID=4024 RepID=A0AA39VXA2_ACESA|nr:hypothetical protein LWI29_037881 [Acer saccharum]